MAPYLTDYAAVDAAMAKVTEAFGRIDILVNNAGISAREPLYQYDPAAFKNIMDLNVTAVFNGCRAVAPIMKAQGGGSIINTSSRSVCTASPPAWAIRPVNLPSTA